MPVALDSGHTQIRCQSYTKRNKPKSALTQPQHARIRRHASGAHNAVRFPGQLDSCTFNGLSEADFSATLLLQCCDRKGVVAAVAQLLAGLNCNILSSDQYSERDSNTFFQRVNLDYSDLTVGTGNVVVLENSVSELARKYEMDWQICYENERKQVAVLVSKYDHCLFDLLVRHKAGDLSCDIPVVISNHPDMEPVASSFGLDFVHIPMDDKGKRAQEEKIEEKLEELGIDLIVLAR